jgi:hypothetical protein
MGLLDIAASLLTGRNVAQNFTSPSVEQKQTTALEQVNAAVITPPEQLRADVTSMSQAVTPEVIQNPEAPLAINQQKTIPGFQVIMSQQTMNNLQPTLSKALNTLMEIIPFVAAEIKRILPNSVADKLLSSIMQNNGGPEAAQ